jgi:hypothetical protein
VLGLVESMRGNDNEAIDLFARALHLHDAIGAPAWRARTLLDWARAEITDHTSGPNDATRARLTECVETARAHGYATIESDGESLLRRLDEEH